MNKININGNISAREIRIGDSTSTVQIQGDIEEWDKGISEEEWDDMIQEAEDFIFNANHNDFHTQNLVIQKNNEIYVNGEKLPHIPKLFGCSCVINRGSRLYINGREKKNGEWKLTLRAIAACLFG